MAWGDMRSGQARRSGTIQPTARIPTKRRSVRRRTSNGLVVCLAILGLAGIGGLAAGVSARTGLMPGSSGGSSVVAATFADLPASDIVNLRFPNDWTDSAALADETPKVLAFAGDGGTFTLFSPRPLYPIPDANAPTAYAPAAEAPMAPPWAEAPVGEAAKAKPVGQPKIALASASSKPVTLSSKPAGRPNAVLNDSQIASIKKRLNLRPDQERYWPAVEAELRKMEYKKDKTPGTRTAQIDMTKVDVEGLKSAGFPLVMSFNDEQRRELKSLAHLLGLESVMSSL